MYKKMLWERLKNQSLSWEKFAQALCCAFDKTSTPWNLKKNGIDI